MTWGGVWRRGAPSIPGPCAPSYFPSPLRGCDDWRVHPGLQGVTVNRAMRAHVLLNAAAGTLARMGTAGAAAGRVREALARAGIAAQVRPVEPRQVAAEARRARDDPEADAVIV